MRTLKLFLAATAVFMSVAASAQFEGSKQVYHAPDYKETLETHKIVAILPFKATISYKRLPKGFDAAANSEEEKKLGTNMQQGMYTYLLRKEGKYSVTFQDVDRTNVLLKQAGVFDNIDVMLPDSLAKILKVDAVIKCSYAYEKTSSEGGAIAKTVLLGSFAGKTAAGALTMQIYNGSNGTLLWRFYKEMNENVTSSASEVMERMMRKVSRNFPYEK